MELLGSLNVATRVHHKQYLYATFLGAMYGPTVVIYYIHMQRKK
jgi:hypothetical protein